MNDNQKAAYLMAQSAKLNATVEGMKVCNYERTSNGLSPAYDEEAFEMAITNHSLGENQIGEFLS